MIATGIDAQEVRQMLTFVADKIIKEEAHLNALDAALGDGDHGITMRIGFEAIARKIAELDSGAGLDRLFTEAGMTFMGATGGAIGVVMGKMLMAAGRTLTSHTRLGADELRDILNSMRTSVSNSGKVEEGDKTILDAILGACQSLSGDEPDLLDALGKAAGGAEASAQKTASMVCRVGRASRLGTRTLGHPDPGAISFAIILRTMSDWACAKVEEST
jgi:phosphoenolpyruvate---glycerone phosphotransferase subunit DhaL